MTISHSGLLFWATLYILKRIVYCVALDVCTWRCETKM